jgi:hypothetical protein
MVSEELSHEEFEEIRLGVRIADKLSDMRMKRTIGDRSRFSRALVAKALERDSFKDLSEKIKGVGRAVDRKIEAYVANVNCMVEELYLQYNEVRKILFYRELYGEDGMTV